MFMAKKSQNPLREDDSDLIKNPIRSPTDSEIHTAAQTDDCGLVDVLEYSC